MRTTTLLIHALPGGVGIVTGFLALSVAKGGGVHRKLPALLAIPAFAPVLVMFYWLWRVRVRRRLQGIVGVSAREAY